MSLVSTLGKIAMGVMVAKGVGKMMGNRAGNGASQGGLGDLGGLLGGGGGQAGGGLLGGLLGNVMGGQQGGGGIGSVLGSLMGGAQGGAGAQGGGLMGQLGGMLGGGAQQGGGLGGLLDSLGGGGGAAAGGLGGMLNQALMGGQPEVTPDAEKQAEILLRAMLMAAKSDGEIDADEREKLTQHLGEVSAEELAFIQEEMARPVDVQSLIDSVPQGMEQQVYLMSLTAIDLDSQAEAQYLHQLAQGLGIDQQACNAIHEQLGVPALYS